MVPISILDWSFRALWFTLNMKETSSPTFLSPSRVKLSGGHMTELTSRNILLFGLTETLAGDLQRALARQNWKVHSEPCLPGVPCSELIERLGASLVFCPAESGR